MGQYYRLTNLTAKESLNPYKIHSGAKLMEQACSYTPVKSILKLIHTTWAHHRLALIGDYAEAGDVSAFDKIWTEQHPDVPVEDSYQYVDEWGKLDPEYTPIAEEVYEAISAYTERSVNLEKEPSLGKKFWVVNEDSGQYLTPSALGDYETLGEILSASWNPSGENWEPTGGVGSALLVALAVGNGKGGGDLFYDDEHISERAGKFVGSWAGCRIAIVFSQPSGEDVSHIVRELFEACKEISYTDLGDGRFSHEFCS